MIAQPFQFAVLRYIHDPITEEFLNIGLVVYSKDSRYLQGRVNKCHQRVSQTFRGVRRVHYSRMTGAIERSIAQLCRRLSQPRLFDNYPERIEPLLAQILPPDSSSLVFGGFGGGLAEDLGAEIEQLYYRLIGRYDEMEHWVQRSKNEK